MATVNVERTSVVKQRDAVEALQLPDPIRIKLGAVLRHARRAELLRGTAILFAIVCSTLLLIVGLDVLLGIRSTPTRWLVWLSGLSVIAWAARRFVVRPWRHVDQLLSAAWQLESAHPEMEEKLTSTVQFLAQGSARANGSQELIAALASSTAEDVSAVDPEDVQVRNSAPYMVGAVVLGLLLTLTVIFWPQNVLAALMNLGMPWSSPSVPSLAATVSPGNITITDGENVTVSVTAENALDSPELIFRRANDQLSVHSMNLTSPEEAIYTLQDVTDSTNYRVRDGGTYSPWYTITVNKRPRLLQVDAQLQFPSYTGLPPATVHQLEEAIIAPPGTKVTLTATCDSVAQAAVIHWDSTIGDKAGDRDATTPTEVEFVWVVHVDRKTELAGMLELRSDADARSELFPIEIRAMPDSPPTVEITDPVLRQLSMRRDDVLAILYEAADDFGLAGIELLTQYDDGEPLSRPLDIGNTSATQRTGIIDFDAIDIPLDSNSVTLWLRADDNRADSLGGSQATETEKIVISLDVGALSLGEQQVQAELREVTAALDLSIAKLQAAQQTAEQLEQSLSNETGEVTAGGEAEREASDHDSNANDKQAGSTNKSDPAAAENHPDENSTGKDVARLVQETADARQSLDELVEKLAGEESLFQPRAEEVQKVNDEDVTPALEEASRMPLTDDEAEQAEHAQRANEHLEEAISELQDVKQQIEQQAKDLELSAQLDDLARQQERLAEQARQAAQHNQPAPDQPADVWRDKQDKLADDVQQMVEDSPEARREQMLRRAEQAEQLARQAEQLAQKQEKLREITDSKREEAPDSEDMKQQLREIIAAEQQEIARETEALENKLGKKRDNSSPSKDDSLPQARQQMEQAAKNLNEGKDQQAEDAARQAADAVKPPNNQSKTKVDAKQDDKAEVGTTAKDSAKPQHAKDGAEKKPQPNDNPPGKGESSQPQSDSNNKTGKSEPPSGDAQSPNNQMADKQEGDKASQIAKQQDRIADAIEAMNDNNLDKAAEKLQEQISERAGELQETAQELSKLTNQDPQAQQEIAKATEQLQQAQDKSQQAQQQMGGTEDPPGSMAQQNGNGQQQQNDKQNQSGQDADKASQDNKPGQQGQAGNQQQQARGQQANNGKPGNNKPGEKQTDNANQQPQNAGQQGTETPADQQGQQAAKDAASQAQRETADALNQAADSLKQASVACKECANPGPNPGQGSGEGKGTGQDQGAQNARPDPAGLAKASDSAKQAGQANSPGQAARQAEQAAQELGQLADEVARQTGFPKRAGSGQQPGGGSSDKQDPTGQPSQEPGSTPGRKPTGVGNVPGDDQLGPQQVRGGSTSNWTAPRSKHDGGVLDGQAGTIPAQYRSLVERYFEELSRRDANKPRKEEQEKQ